MTAALPARRPPFEDWFPDAAFDATYGYDLPALERIEPPGAPADFDAFWQQLARLGRDVDPRPELGESQRVGPAEVFPLQFSSLGGVRIGGWFTRPASGPIRRAMVVSHGYGGRQEPLLDQLPSQCAAVFPVARGLPAASLLPDIPSDSAGHVLHGIESRDNYVHGGCVADVWCATTALLQLLPDPPERLDYSGSSFGGGIGALALPWDDRFHSAILRVPSFGHHDLRLAMPCVGSGESVRRYVAEHPGIREVLGYFDAAAAATRLRIPVLAAPALWDPAVPPPGQFAVANALAGPTDRFIISAGHVGYPTEEREVRAYAGAYATFLERSVPSR